MNVTISPLMEAYTRRDAAAAEVESLAERNDSWTAADAARFEQLVSTVETAAADVATHKRNLIAGVNSMPRTTTAGLPPSLETSGDIPRTAEHWQDVRSGRLLPVCRAGDKLADTVDHSDEEFGHNAVGRMMQGLVTGNWKFAGEIRNALSTTGSGQTLVPAQLGTQIIDLARARAVTMAAGAGSVTMESDSLNIAKVVADPTFEVKAENDSFTGSDITFGAIGLYARTLGTIVTASRELAEDAPNFATMIESVLAAALAVEMDRLALLGNAGSDGVTGLHLQDGVGATTSVGAIDWSDLHNATVAIRSLNHSPNAYIVHPTIGGDLDIITSGDGTNSAKLWLGAPPSLAGVTRFETTGVTTGDAFVGDFRQMLYGFRTGVMIETSTVADEAFARHQVKFKIALRFDVTVTHGSAFHYLSGITT